MNDPTSQLRSATRRAKSDVANKLVSMFLHELSRTLAKAWKTKVDSEDYEAQVRDYFANKCPYCNRDLVRFQSVLEHLDGMNRYRAGLHVAGNVLVACRECNLEKRRDDSIKDLKLAPFGWASFLSHGGDRCGSPCRTCLYWQKIWPEPHERKTALARNLNTIRAFRANFPEFEAAQSKLAHELPLVLVKLYTDCQNFAEQEIRLLLSRMESLHL